MTLRLKIEIVRGGDESDVTEIHRFDISNIGRSNGGRDHVYQVVEIDMENNKGFVFEKGILHRREQGAIALIRKVLSHCHRLSK